MKRVLLLIATNLAVMLVLGVVLSIVMHFFGMEEAAFLVEREA